MSFTVFNESVSEADKIADKTEEIIGRLMLKPASLFTAGDLAFLFHWSSKVRLSTSAEYEKKLYEKFVELEKSVESQEVK
jgi:hypothetical protein